MRTTHTSRSSIGDPSRPAPSDQCSSTLLDLVEAIQDGAKSDSEAVAVMEHMFRTRRLVLGDGHSGRRIQLVH